MPFSERHLLGGILAGNLPEKLFQGQCGPGTEKTYGFEKLVVFGDSVNDLSMFRIADEAYAVAGSAEDVKAAASAVIGSNEEDAVAAFLKARWNEQV